MGRWGDVAAIIAAIIAADWIASLILNWAGRHEDVARPFADWHQDPRALPLLLTGEESGRDCPKLIERGGGYRAGSPDLTGDVRTHHGSNQ